MLKKVEKIEVNYENIFLHDKLNREETVELFTNLVRTIEQPFTICLDAPWGGGKTTFIEMWSKYLEKQNFVTLHFNAWENDFTNEPFISLVSEIGEQLSIQNPEKITTLKNYKDNVFEMGGKLIKKTIPLAVKLATLNTLEIDDLKEIVEKDDTKAISDFLSKTAEEQIANYGENKNIKNNFKETLTTFAQKVIEDENKNAPIIVFIDDLDRCKPSYAIELLENIKHIFNLDNFIFVLSIDKVQLKHSIKSFYGEGLNAEGYLKKFIDIDLRLPFLVDEKYLYSLITDKFNMSQLAIFQHQNIDEIEHAVNLFKGLIDIYHLSLRDIEQTMTEVNMITRMMFQNERKMSLSLLIFLLVMKSHNPFTFQKLKNKTDWGKKIIFGLERNEQYKKLFAKDYYILYSMLLASNLNQSEFNQLKNKNLDEDGYSDSIFDLTYIKDEDIRNRIYEVLNIYPSICFNKVKSYIQKLNMVSQYV